MGVTRDDGMRDALSDVNARAEPPGASGSGSGR